MDDLISRQTVIDAAEAVYAIFRQLGIDNAFDRPGFWCHEGKDYKVIPTNYHKGYDQALEDAERRIKAILEELCYG